MFYFLFADLSVDEEEFFEEVVVEENGVSKDEKKLSGEEAEPKEPKRQIAEKPKKLKPQYAGARRAPDKVKSEDEKKSRVKNKWFSSKTHPKVEKKETVETPKESPIELPANRPHYTKTSHILNSYNIIPLDLSSNASTEKAQPMPSEIRPQQQSEGYSYPRGGFQAPKGHVYFTAEWLYWRTRQEGMEFATVKKVDFDFQSGFRVGLGVHLPYDRWDIYINYTRFNPEDSDRTHGSIYPLYLFQGTDTHIVAVSEARAKWEIEFQNVDIEIGRPFYIAKTLVFRPFFGMKGAWIDQDAHVRYAGGFIPAGQTFRTHFENDFKGAGPLIGIESNWLIGADFSFFGNLAAALVVGHFDNEQVQHQLDGAKTVDLNSDFNLVSPTLQMIAGLAWDRNFNRERWHVGLSAGFETQYWWSQNQIEQFTDSDFPIYVREKGDLAFYGLTLRGRFDF
jgi:hypothetical protein